MDTKTTQECVGKTYLLSLRRDGHQFLADRFEVRGGQSFALLGVADQKGQIAEAVDAPGHAAGEFLEGGEGVGVDYLAARARRFQAVGGVGGGFLDRKGTHQALHAQALVELRHAVEHGQQRGLAGNQ